MIAALYSIFVFIFLGYLAKRLRMISGRHGNILLGFLLNFAIPSAIFTGVYHADISMQVIGVFLLALMCSLGASALGYLFVRKILGLDFTLAITIAFLIALHNTLFLGVPIVQGALGEESAHKAIVFDQFCTGLPLALLTPILISLSGKAKFRLRAVGVRLFASPLFLAMLFGFGLKLLPFSIPELLFAPILALAACATPVALFAIGIQLDFSALRTQWRHTLIVLGFGMFVAPALFLAMLYILRMPISPDHQTALLELSMPPLISSVAVIARAGLESKLAISSIVLGIFVAAFSAPLWLYLSHL